jgi:uncharacterized protein (DUF1800 family)
MAQAELPAAIATSTADRTVTWSPYTPDSARPWNLALAGHLYRRAGFGANWSELRQAVADGPEKTIDRLTHPSAEAEAFNRAHDEYEAADDGSLETLRAWWLRRMIESPSPLLEKMTLFWHGHFAVRGLGVEGRLMRAHVARLRAGAVGRFDALLKGLFADPAFFLGLAAEQNRKARPNENFARVLLEDFTLGPGQFSDRDVRDVARAATGWQVL